MNKSSYDDIKYDFKLSLFNTFNKPLKIVLLSLKFIIFNSFNKSIVSFESSNLLFFINDTIISQ